MTGREPGWVAGSRLPSPMCPSVLQTSSCGPPSVPAIPPDAQNLVVVSEAPFLQILDVVNQECKDQSFPCAALPFPERVRRLGL